MSNIILHIDSIIDDIISGDTFREMAKKYKCGVQTIYNLISQQEHSARAKQALMISAASYAEKAEDVLLNAKSNLTEIQRARELAQHYRWMASKRAPNVFGDKIEIVNPKQKPAPLTDEQFSRMIEEAKQHAA